MLKNGLSNMLTKLNINIQFQGGETMQSTKRIFGITMANYLVQSGIELIEIRAGEVTGKSDRPSYLKMTKG
ncbi:hypothetical protein COM54_07430 [Bacillus toyonensis]|uniref:hypothetical protein n=1 Tax=Bacillus toyonensis TaxID=155322 RepID=UPI000BF7D133|nr:hypothetical protein [Bacillus toyonensis]PGE12052.1 hypothetical protein COM54_07430 [Bacillus toyonensis]